MVDSSCTPVIKPFSFHIFSYLYHALYLLYIVIIVTAWSKSLRQAEQRLGALLRQLGEERRQGLELAGSLWQDMEIWQVFETEI